MGTTLSITFPLGRYHATPWDMGANSGAVEWPPSPWRIARALLAVAHERCPEIASDAVDAVLARLGNPAAYLTPASGPGSTRHYMADMGHRSDETGGTSQVLDAFVSIEEDAPLLIHWDTELSDSETDTLSMLTTRLPYLGRSESICIARLLESPATPDENWWRLGEGGAVEETVVLGLDGPPNRAVLEQTTESVRKERRPYPVGTRLLRYGRIHSTLTPSARPAESQYNAIRFQLHGSVPVRMRNFVLATDAMHGLARKLIDNLDPELTASLIGKDGSGPRRSDHDHLHIGVIPGRTDAGRPTSVRDSVASLVLWTKHPLPDIAVSAMTSRPQTLHTRRKDLDQHLPSQRLLVSGIGHLPELVPPTWVGASTEWRSETPYLPVRHRHRNRTDAEYLLEDVAAECKYRGLPAPVSAELVDDDATRSQIVEFRRRRMNSRASDNRRGVYIRLHFAESVTGPVFLGALSHFGFGQFVADR
ncbi:type I-G CRISPR-associated protein Csb2 [Prescottella subtropica]|uniref:type I-G CRISPR-associated protein Csb2 n=1 Tax=Prescottella subtropica TaxID=2545757 RepID=UPI001386C792|nr:type I-U CRISPR-associated protein Csb2 [Prescottella subtropica]